MKNFLEQWGVVLHQLHNYYSYEADGQVELVVSGDKSEGRATNHPT